jgi:uncharacterized protein YcfJ
VFRTRGCIPAGIAAAVTQRRPTVFKAAVPVITGGRIIGGLVDARSGVGDGREAGATVGRAEAAISSIRRAARR